MKVSESPESACSELCFSKRERMEAEAEAAAAEAMIEIAKMSELFWFLLS